MNKLKNFLEQIPNAHILDVGTGRGNFITLLDYLYKDYEKIVGIDISESAVKSASKFFENNPKIEILNQDINNYDFPVEHFDIVCLSNSLHHLDDKKKTFKNMERLVKPGGYLLFNEMMKDHLNEKQESHLLLHHFSAKIDREIGRFHDDTYNRLEIVDIIDFWDMDVPKQEPKEEDISAFANTVDRVMNQLSDESMKNVFSEEAKKIKQYIFKYGVEACTQLIVIVKRT